MAMRHRPSEREMKGARGGREGEARVVQGVEGDLYRRGAAADEWRVAIRERVDVRSTAPWPLSALVRGR